MISTLVIPSASTSAIPSSPRSRLIKDARILFNVGADPASAIRDSS
jgi:hypothetical protein